ncbi:MAG TPA: glycosyltransferase [Opitutaceae bacterium]|nr:glycosyltransferase [Opitutaceae bacterium]
MKTSSAESPVALVHHWMEFFRGGEAVLDQFGRLFPQAPICILVYNEKHLPPSLLAHQIHASLMQRWPWLRERFRNLLPVFPEIIRSMRIPRGTRFVLSSDASLIKGIPLPDEAVHVCYCHSPPRYLWGYGESYAESLASRSRLGSFLFAAGMPRLRAFDWRMAQRVNYFIANSRCVQDRIKRFYGRDSVVINPPVNIERFNPSRPREDFYLIVSALVPYKRVDLAVEACSRLRRRLVVIGAGPEMKNLKRRAKSCVVFLGWRPDAVVIDYLERCRAFLFPGIEDFGITPCEAQAAGAPVIAYGEGGALEIVREGTTGLFFRAQTAPALMKAIMRFERGPAFGAPACQANVRHLRPERFRREIRSFLVRQYPEIFSTHVWPAESAAVGAAPSPDEANESSNETANA